MELDEAFRHAIDGNAILFLGAGFSLGARNEMHQDFPLATDLAIHLMTSLGEEEPVPLQTASELYINKHGETGLLKYLKQHLGVLDVADHHKIFAQPNWRRVYTTNYDEVFEFAARTEGRRIRSLILEPKIPTTTKNQIDCVHINGFLPIANAHNFNSAIILSETAYLTNRFATSPWATLLRSDIETARAVLFAGYSLADLDIGRILLAIDRVKDKCVFVLKENPSLALRTTVQKFGHISRQPGVQASASILQTLLRSHKPQQQKLRFSSFRAPQRVIAQTTSATAGQVFSLLVKGDIELPQLVRSLAEDHPTYTVKRTDLDAIAKGLSSGTQVSLLLSRLANGKTLLVESLAARLQDQFDIYVFRKETPTLAEELRHLRTPAKPTIIVFDDYTKQLSTIRELRLGAGPEQYLLLTSRTPAHLTHKDQLHEALGDARAAEYRVDSLSESDLEQLDDILAGAGLLGDVAPWSRDRRIHELYKGKGASEFGGILLWLFDSPHVRERLAELFTSLKGRGDAQRVVIAAMILTHIGQPPDIDDIATFIGAGAINQALLSEHRSIANIVHLDRRALYPRSSLFAVATLRALWSDGNIPSVLQEMLRSAWELRHESQRFRRIARDLMRYSLLRRIAPQIDPSAHVSDYYEAIRNSPACVNNQHFWLQFALADIARNDFALAEKHLDQSYAIARRIKGFDTYQIDNVWALFLLMRAIRTGFPDDSFRVFVEFNTILSRQMRERRHGYYPFRVARHYKDFWARFARLWGPEHKSVFLSACEHIYRAALRVDTDLAAMEDISQCRESIKEVLLAEGRTI